MMDPTKISSIVADGDEMRRIDLEISEILSITRVQEVASTRLADLITYHLPGLPRSRETPILVVVGKGNNGANGIAAARHLIGRGHPNIKVLLGYPKSDMADMPQQQLKLYEHFGGKTIMWNNGEFVQSNEKGGEESKVVIVENLKANGGIIVDGLLGTGITTPPRSTIKDMIEWINSTKVPVLALDVPSGLNHVTGEILQPCIKAKYTYNFHILKSGQVVENAKSVIGELWTADTDLTYTAWEEAGVKTEDIQELFSYGPIRRVF